MLDLGLGGGEESAELAEESLEPFEALETGSFPEGWVVLAPLFVRELLTGIAGDAS